MDKLASDLQTISLLPHREYTSNNYAPDLTSAERDAILEQVKVYGRDPENSDPIFTKEASRMSQCSYLF
jgi:hypothetical protein